MNDAQYIEYFKWLGAFRLHLRELYNIDIAGMLDGHPKETKKMGKIFGAAYERGVDAHEFAKKYGLALTQSSNIN